MFIYLGILLILLIFLIISKYKQYNCTKNFVIVSMSMLGCVAALRGNTVGNDTQNYIDLFEKIAAGVNTDIWSERFEKGYLLLNKILAAFTSNPQMVLVVTSIMIYSGFIYFIVQYSKDYWMSVFLFVTMGFFGQTMNAIRLCIAFSLLMVAYDRFLKNHMIQFVVLVLFATLFHQTTIVFLFVIVIKYLKCNERLIKVWLGLTVLGYVLIRGALGILFRLFPSYQSYMGSSYETGGVSFAILLYIFVWGMVFAVGYYLQKIYRPQPGELSIYNSMNIMTMVSVSVFVCALYFSLFDRIAQYFGIFVIVHLPNCIELIDDYRTRYKLKLLIVLFFLFYFVAIQLLRPEWNAIQVYVPFWVK